MGQRDFLLKEEKIDKLPLRAQKHFYVQHYGTHGSQQTGRSMCLVRFFLYYFQIRMRQDAPRIFILANVNETQRSSATLSGMSGRQKGKGASRWRR